MPVQTREFCYLPAEPPSRARAVYSSLPDAGAPASGLGSMERSLLRMPARLRLQCSLGVQSDTFRNLLRT